MVGINPRASVESVGYGWEGLLMEYTFKPEDLIITGWPNEPSSFVSRVPTGVKVVHVPTGSVVTCNSHRSQHKNRVDALGTLDDILRGDS